MLFARSDAAQEEPSATTVPAKSKPPTPLPSSSSSSSIASSQTPRRNSPLKRPHAFESPSQLGLLTPVSSIASLSPPPRQQRQVTSQPATPQHAQSPRIRRGGSLRRPLYPTSPSLSLELHLLPAQHFMTSAESSRPVSPERRSRPLSPRPEHLPPRPPSRCESLLRDTLRRADEYDRSRPRRSDSRSPNRWPAAGSSSSRPRGNSLLGTLSKADDGASGDDDECFGDALNCYAPNGRDLVSYRFRAPPKASSPRFVLGRVDGHTADAANCPYGSPSSPTPMPPSMLRTRTAPAVPRASRPLMLDEQSSSSGCTTRPAQSPRSGRLSLPNTAIGGGGPSGSQTTSQASSETSPKLRQHGLSPHEVVLRQKLTVLLKAGSASPDEKADHQQPDWRVRNHQRSQSHGVTIVTTQKHHEDHPASVSPHSLGTSSLSNSASDIAKLSSTTPSLNRRRSVPHKANGASSPSSPSEPMTPPPTPPFNARTASEVCKRMDGYVSFANVEGLGEPPGMDIDADPTEEAAGRWARWLRMLPWANGMNIAPEHDADQMVEHNKRP